MDYTLGGDPEFFLKRGRSLVSAHDVVPGTKEKPHALKNCSIQADGVAVEFNIKPSRSAEEFSKNVQEALDDMRSVIPDEYSFVFEPVARFNSKYFETIPEHARQLGCEPDFSVFTKKLKEIPQTAANKPFRTASGHLHIGWTDGQNVNDPDYRDEVMMVASAVDNVLAPMRFIWDNDNERAKLYGSGNPIRFKPYGVEYRHLSNKWLKYPCLWPWFYNVIGRVLSELERADSRTIRILTSDHQYYALDEYYFNQYKLQSQDPNRFEYTMKYSLSAVARSLVEDFPYKELEEQMKTNG